MILVNCLVDGALALLSASENELGRTAALLWADVNKAATNRGTVITANAVGSVGAVDGVVARALLGSLALRANSAIGYSAKATNAGPAGKAATASAADTVRVVVRRRKMLAVRRGTSTAGAVSTASNASADKVAHSLAALTGGKVLAALVLGSGTLLEFLNRRRVAGLADRVLSSTCLTRTESASHWGSREASGTGECRAGTLGSLGLCVNSKSRRVLLVSATEGIGGWRRKRNHVLGRGVGLLGRRGAAGSPGAGVALVGRRHMKDRGVNLGRRSGKARGWRRRGIGHTRHGVENLDGTIVLLVARVDDILVLAGHLVEDQIDTRLVRLLNSSSVAKLLAIGVHLGSVWRVGVAVSSRHVHAAKLLRGQSKQLLLELLLPLGKVHFSSQELGSNVGVHLAIVKLERRRSQDLVIVVWLLLLLLLELVDAAEAGADGRLGNTLVGAVVLLPGHAVVVVSSSVGTNVVLCLGIGRRSRRLGRCRRLRRSAKAGQKVRTAGAGGGNRILGNGGNLWRRSNAETLKLSALSARGKAGGRAAESGLGLEVVVLVVVRHLSKTASVHAHFGSLKRGSNKG